MGQQITQDASCCRSEGGSRNCELNLCELSDHQHAQSLVQIHGCSNPPDFPDPDDFDCCRAPGEDMDASLSKPMETLSYTPTRWDLKSTVDMERSHSRYSKIVVHSSRARTQRRSKAWEEWLRAAVAGRTVTLLMGAGFRTPRAAASEEDSPGECQKIEATYYLDRGLTKISILLPGGADGSKAQPPITILVDNIKVVCALTEFMLLSEAMEAQLDEAERDRAALIQYLGEDNTPKRVCFLEESESAKDRSIQALTALWLEKRNDHSMWF